MDRRKALVNMGILTGGMVLLPSCEFSKEKISFALHNLEVTETQEAIVKDIVDSLIPGGEILGSGSLKVQDFVWVMVDDCLEEETQTAYISGLNEFKAQIKELTGEDFSSMTQERRIEVYKKIVSEGSAEESEGVSEAVSVFFKVTKNFAIQGYLQSEYIMTEIMPYSLVPGRYGNCETIDQSKRINIYG